MHLAEALLERVQRSVDGGHAFDLHGEHSAGFNRPAVDVDRAGPAMRGVAADVRAGQVQMLAQIVDEQRARLDFRRDGAAVDRHADFDLGDIDHRHGCPYQAVARAKARSSARRVITPAILVRYSVEPRPSSAGAATASAASAARFRLGPSRAVPIAALAAFSACRGRSPTLVSPMAQVATRQPETVIN